MPTPDLSALGGTARRGVSYRPPVTGSVGFLSALVFTMIGSLFALCFVWVVKLLIELRGFDTETPVFIGLQALFIVGFAGPIVYFVALVARGFIRSSGVGAALPAFAAANGFRFQKEGAVPSHPGALFRSPFTSRTFDVLIRDEPRHIEIGNVIQDIPAGRATTHDTWGYLAIKLDRRLPHLLLEATASAQGTQGALPVSVDRSQRLSLEGDFDKHFELYVPKGYETDALYIFTPDLMALLTDRLGGWHVEIIDDWVFVYAPHDFVAGADSSLYRRIFEVIDLLTAKLDDRTARYRDDHGDVVPAYDAAGRTPSDAPIAVEGQRMVAGGSWYHNLFWLSLAVIGGMCVLFFVGTFIALVAVQLIYGSPTVR